MKTIEKSIEVERSLRGAYKQWTRFGEFPRFMKGVKKVTQLDDERLHWEAEVSGKPRTTDFASVALGRRPSGCSEHSSPHLRTGRSVVRGKSKEWDAIVTDQIPDRRIGWQSEEGDYMAGVVDFEGLGPNRTRVNLHILYDPDGFVESAEDARGAVSDRVQAIQRVH